MTTDRGPGRSRPRWLSARGQSARAGSGSAWPLAGLSAPEIPVGGWSQPLRTEECFSVFRVWEVHFSGLLVSLGPSLSAVSSTRKDRPFTQCMCLVQTRSLEG